MDKVIKQRLATALCNPMQTLLDMAEADLRDRMAEMMSTLKGQIIEKCRQELNDEMDEFARYEVRGRVALAAKVALDKAMTDWKQTTAEEEQKKKEGAGEEKMEENGKENEKNEKLQARSTTMGW